MLLHGFFSGKIIMFAFYNEQYVTYLLQKDKINCIIKNKRYGSKDIKR